MYPRYPDIVVNLTKISNLIVIINLVKNSLLSNGVSKKEVEMFVQNAVEFDDFKSLINYVMDWVKIR